MTTVKPGRANWGWRRVRCGRLPAAVRPGPVLCAPSMSPPTLRLSPAARASASPPVDHRWRSCWLAD